MFDDVEFMDRQQLKEEVRNLRSERQQIKTSIQVWIRKQGHDRCWYYPEIFKKIIEIFRIEEAVEPNSISKEEFQEGCKRFQDEEYNSADTLI